MITTNLQYIGGNLKMTKEELINFIYYLEDKVEECYKVEVRKAVERVVKEIEKYESK